MKLHWKFCPLCGGNTLAPKALEETMFLACTAAVNGAPCKFEDYDNPLPVAVALIPRRRGIVLVQRGVAPFIGEYCLPAGYVNNAEDPLNAVKREAHEESGLVVRPVANVWSGTPQAPGRKLNSMLMFYLCRTVGGTMQAGSDAQSVGIFTKNNLPKICFPSHAELIEAWFAGEFGTLRKPRYKLWVPKSARKISKKF